MYTSSEYVGSAQAREYGSKQFWIDLGAPDKFKYDTETDRVYYKGMVTMDQCATICASTIKDIEDANP